MEHAQRHLSLTSLTTSSRVIGTLSSRLGYAQGIAPQYAAMLDGVLACAAVGGARTVRARLEDLVARTGADELLLTSQIYEHSARRRSYEIVAGL